MFRCAISLALACALTTIVHARDKWSLKTDDTSLTVAVNAGQLVIQSLSSTGVAPDWIGAAAPIRLPDHVFIGNISRPVHWKFAGSVKDRTGDETTLHFLCREPKLELLSIWQAHSGPGPVE